MPISRTLLLASASPRRSQLLAARGYAFDVRATNLDETVAADEEPRLAVLRLAIEKAMAGATTGGDSQVILGADTTVLSEGRMLGKPTDPADAASMLLSLAGRNHQVVTAWGLVLERVVVASGFTSSTVRMREISRVEADAYANSGEPDDKAGAYALQGNGRRFIAAVLGCSDNVIGLPIAQLVPVLATFGVEPSS